MYGDQGEQGRAMRRLRSVRYCRCGTRLARDNPGALCGACEVKVRDLALGPPEVPANFWDTDRMRDALAAWHIGSRHRRVPHPSVPRTSDPQDIVAGWVGITQPQLSRIENGPPIKDLDKLIYWARMLRIPPHLLWFKLPEQRRAWRALEEGVRWGEEPAVEVVEFTG